MSLPTVLVHCYWYLNLFGAKGEIQVTLYMALGRAVLSELRQGIIWERGIYCHFIVFELSQTLSWFTLHA